MAGTQTKIEKKVEDRGPDTVEEPNYSEEEVAEVERLDGRVKELKESRQDVEGENIDEIWADADRAYKIASLTKEAKEQLVQGEDWGDSEVSQYVKLDNDHWQSMNIQPTEYIKIQGVLSVVIDQIPDTTFEPFSSLYFNSSLIQKELHRNSWDTMHSVKQLRYFTFNCAKYGFAIGHTFAVRKGWPVKLFDPETGEYYETFHAERDGVFRENLNPKFTWVDDMANPADPLSARDWYREFKLPREEAERRYGDMKYWDNVAKGDVSPTVNRDSDGSAEQTFVETDTVTVGIYENKVRDQLAVQINDVWVIISHPLPGVHKMLSCWYAGWSIRSASTIYGIGIPEAMRQDKNLKDKVRNMSADALIASIYPFGFYSGANEMTGTGTMRYRPGEFHKVTDPKNISYIKAPGPGLEADRFMENLDKDIDEESAYSRALGGELIGKTAFEVKNSRDAGLQRLQLPLKEISDALGIDAVLTAYLHEQILSVPDVLEMVDESLIERYREEVSIINEKGNLQPDPELFQEVVDPETEEVKTYAYVFPEVQLGLEQLPDGTLRRSEEKQFFRIKPKGIRWEGIVRVKPHSILTRQPQIEKIDTMELFDLVMPLLTDVPPELVPRIAPAVRQIFKSFDKDPYQWLPPEFNETLKSQPPQQSQDQGSLFLGPDGSPFGPSTAEGGLGQPGPGGQPTISGRGRERSAIRKEQGRSQARTEQRVPNG